jgi:hypothetical protein
MLIYLAPPAAIIIAWFVFTGAPLARSRQWNGSSTVRTIAGLAALVGSLIGLVVGSLSGNELVAYLGAELIGGLLGAGVGAAVGAGAVSAGKRSRMAVTLVCSVLYWIFALFTSATWLVIAMLGDCFNQTCIHHRQQALPQTAWILVFYLAVFLVLLTISGVRARQRGR